MAPPRSVYDGIIGAGLLGDLPSPDVRSAIAAHHVSLNFIQSQLDPFRLIALSGHDQVANVINVRSTQNPTAGWGWSWIVCRCGRTIRSSKR